MKSFAVHGLLMAMIGVGACSTRTETATTNATPTQPAVAAASEAPKAHDCTADGGMAGEPVQYPEAVQVKDGKGAMILRAGASVGAAPVVTVADLLANPSTYAGKTVRLEGNVSAMCTHKRGWFAVQDNDKSGRFVRIISTPAFLVPENAIGTRARAEGVVELLDADPSMNEHIAKEHQLGAAAASSPTAAKTVIVRARGAEFI